MKLTPQEQLDLQMALTTGPAANQHQQQLQNAAINNPYSQYGMSSTQNLPFTVTAIGGGGGAGVISQAGNMSLGGQVQPSQQSFFPNSPHYPLTQPSLEFQVDMIFAAVEKHLRKLIREEMARAARSLPESETEE